MADPVQTRCHGVLIFLSVQPFFDRTVRGALSSPHTPRAPGLATQDHAPARDSNAAQGNTQDMEAKTRSTRVAARPEDQATDSISWSDCHLRVMDSADTEAVTPSHGKATKTRTQNVKFR